MLAFSNCGPRRHRGDILIESVIGLLLMAIVGLGITYVSSRAVVSQRDMTLQNIAVNQMRDLLAMYGKTLCTNSALAAITLPTQTAVIPLNAICTAAGTVTIGGRSVVTGTTLGTVVLTTRTQESSLFGGIIRVGDET